MTGVQTCALPICTTPPVAMPEEEVHTHEYPNPRADAARERYQPISRAIEGGARHFVGGGDRNLGRLRTINFPYESRTGYGYIACQVCHGHKACVRCMEKTPFLQLGKDPGSSKTVYMRHRMWLPENDPWRKRGDLFNGKEELEGRRRVALVLAQMGPLDPFFTKLKLLFSHHIYSIHTFGFP